MFHSRMPAKKTLVGVALVAVSSVGLVATSVSAGPAAGVVSTELDQLGLSPGPTSTRPAAGRLESNGVVVRPDRETNRASVTRILKQAAIRQQVDPKLVLALAYWESGWDQSRVSITGAVGLMQVEPATAQEAGPALLGRTVDIGNPYDNADVGVAVLRANLDAFHDPALALAAYYQGPNSLRANGMLPDAQTYSQGILALATRMAA